MITCYARALFKRKSHRPQEQTPRKQRKISDLTAEDAITLLQPLNQFQDCLDDDDDDLPSGLLSALEEYRTKLEAIIVRNND